MINILNEVLEAMTGERSLLEVVRKRDALELVLETGEERDNAIAGQVEYLTTVIEQIRDYDIMNKFVYSGSDISGNVPGDIKAPKPKPLVLGAPVGVEQAIHDAYGASKKIQSPPGVIGEVDPHGTAPHTAGAKMDAGKPLAGSCMAAFAKALRDVVDIYTFGAKKYCVDGWEKVPDGENRYRDALYRHLLAHEETPLDADSGMSHLAHACWNMLAWSELVLRRQGIESDGLREDINEDAGC